MPTRDALFLSLNASISELTSRWEIYEQLFDSGEESVALLNSSGSYVFFLLQRLLLDDTMLALSRLTDPASSDKKGRTKNASINYLIEIADPSLSAADRDYVNAASARLTTHVRNVRVHRTKSIAHADLPHSLGIVALPDVEYSELEGAMKELGNLMLKLGTNAARRVGGYSQPVIAFGTDGNSLLAVLRQAKAAR